MVKTQFIYGKNTVLEMINNHPKLILTLYTLSKSHWITLASKKNITVQMWSKQQFNEQFPNQNHQFIAVKIQKWPYLDRKTFLNRIQNHTLHNKIILILDHIYDSFNFGAIIRTATACNVAAIIIPNKRQIQLNEHVAKVAVGTLFKIPIVKVANLASIIQVLKKYHYWICTSDLKNIHQKPSLPNDLIDLNLVLIVGNEARGTSNQLQKLADFNYLIPMKKTTESLNVSVATGVILYEIRNRQKFWRN